MIRARDPLADPEPLIRRVYAYVAYRIGDGPDAEDVTSEVFERARESLCDEPLHGSALTLREIRLENREGRLRRQMLRAQAGIEECRRHFCLCWREVMGPR